MKKDFGVITEQGYAIGKFGFDKLKEKDANTILESEKEKEKKTNTYNK